MEKYIHNIYKITNTAVINIYIKCK